VAITTVSTIWVIEWSRRLAVTFRVSDDPYSAEDDLLYEALIALVVPLAGWALARHDALGDRIGRIAFAFALTAWFEVFWLMEWGFYHIDYLRHQVRFDGWFGLLALGWDDFVDYWIVPVLLMFLIYGFWKRRCQSSPWEITGLAIGVVSIWIVVFNLPRVQY
jgi:hypothetical protein